MARDAEWVKAAGRLGTSLRSMQDKLTEASDEEMWGIGRDHMESEEGRIITHIVWAIAQADVADMDRKMRRHMSPNELTLLLFQTFADGIIFTLRGVQHEGT